MKLYISSAYANKNHVPAWKKELEAAGYEVISTWHQEDPDGRKYRKFAERDVKELEQADAVIVFTQNADESQGGMWFEMGFMAAHFKEVIMVGSLPACVFARLPQVQRFEDLEDFLYGVGE